MFFLVFFVGTLELNLEAMPNAAKRAKHCSLDMLPDESGTVSEKRRKPPPKTISLFEQKRVKGFWPCYRRDETGLRELTVSYIDFISLLKQQIHNIQWVTLNFWLSLSLSESLSETLS